MNNHQKKINKIANWIYLYNLAQGRTLGFYKSRKWTRKATKQNHITIH